MAQSVETLHTVSQITGSIKEHLEARFSFISVVGEISNFHRHSSGHLYFSLKDADATISGVMFRGNAMSMFFRPDNGMEVICRGSITVYPPRGNYQIVVSEMLPRGEGALQAAFERLKRTLFEEGLFDVTRKQPIPAFPRRIALITSPTGAAIKDMISVIKRRNPAISIILVPVQVQGAGAAEEIAAAMDRCNAFNEIDVIITGRGGGSIEDLWAFNEEIVARAIARSKIPVVSAVGHEVDFTIADFAADLRAATPSVAAEIVVPALEDVLENLVVISDTLWKCVDSTILSARTRLTTIMKDRAFSRPLEKIQRRSQLLDDRFDTLRRIMDHAVQNAKTRIEIIRQRLITHDPGRIQQQGYAIVRKSGRIVRSSGELQSHDRIDISFHDGVRTSVVE